MECRTSACVLRLISSRFACLTEKRATRADIREACRASCIVVVKEETKSKVLLKFKLFFLLVSQSTSSTYSKLQQNQPTQLPQYRQLQNSKPRQGNVTADRRTCYLDKQTSLFEIENHFASANVSAVDIDQVCNRIKFHEAPNKGCCFKDCNHRNKKEKCCSMLTYADS